MKQVLSALRAIAGNDDVKDAIVRAGGTESIVAAMTRHLASPQVPARGTGGGMVGRESQLSVYICVMLFPFPQAVLREA